jgi:hypothetical protein
MIVSTQDKLGIKGHLTISKVFPDGAEELVFDDKNVIVSGFGWSLAYLFSRLGSDNITDFQIDRFQLGVSGNSANQVSSTYELSGPLSSVQEYIGTTTDSNLYAFSAYQWKNGTATNSPTPIYAKIPFYNITKLDERSVRYTIFVDKDSCNGIQRDGSDANLNEIGLFVKNPRKDNPESSVLAAYRHFSDITKTEDFGLIFRWTITFG